MSPRTVIISATSTVCEIGPSLTAEAKATVFWLRAKLPWRLLLNCTVRVYDIVVVCCFCVLYLGGAPKFSRLRRSYLSRVVNNRRYSLFETNFDLNFL